MNTNKYKAVNHHHTIQPDQKRINVGGDRIIADENMVDLIIALRDTGLKTRSHCGGHGSGFKFITILLDNVIAEIRPVNERDSSRTKYNGKYEILLSWESKRKKIKTEGRDERRMDRPNSGQPAAGYPDGVERGAGNRIQKESAPAMA